MLATTFEPIGNKEQDRLDGAFPPTVTSASRRGSGKSTRYTFVCVLVFLGVAVVCVKAYNRQYHSRTLVHVHEPPVPPKGFDWFSLAPSEEIEWSPCFSGQLCARLILPLDYLSPPGYGPNATIALRMIPATGKENFRGTILVNPGGPGGSGTGFIGEAGDKISRIIGGSFNVLGFDPRGTGASTPSAQCFNTEAEMQIFGLQEGHLLLNLNDSSVGLAYAHEKVISTKCEQELGGIGKEDANGTAAEWGVARFMSTPSVATDMLQITQKLGEERLKYWGFSYGTILGQYFAGMYPDKIERLIIDGVFDGHNYRDTKWNSNLVDTDAVFHSFHAFCHEAGPEKCPLYAPSVAEIESRVQAIMDKVEAEPIPLPFAQDGPIVVTRKVLHKYAFNAAYFPFAMFASLADVLFAAEQTNQTALVALAPKFSRSYECQCSAPPMWKRDNSAFQAIACADGEPLTYEPEVYREWYEALAALSSFGAPMWGSLALRCASWNVRPKWRYEGPLGVENTSYPILLVQPRYDTVCPLSDARKVRERYGGAGLLVQNSYGHCSLSAPSLCTAKHVRAYFENGTIPEEGTTCEVDALPFVGAVDRDNMNMMSIEDQELLEVLKGLSGVLPTFGNL